MRHFAVLCLAAGLLFGGCKKRELRGWVEKSADGKTYLSVDEPNGSCVLSLDGREWKLGLTGAGPIKPGVHALSCDNEKGTEVGFTVASGTTFHFDSWGP